MANRIFLGAQDKILHVFGRAALPRRPNSGQSGSSAIYHAAGRPLWSAARQRRFSTGPRSLSSLNPNPNPIPNSNQPAPKTAAAS
jgi:hypothetical protein